MLNLDGDGMRAIRLVGNLDNVHRLAASTIEDSEDATHKECGTSHQHQGELHGGILLATRTPNADKQIHGDKCHLVEHEHREHVDADEEAKHACAEEREPQEILLVHVPRYERARKYNDGGKQQHSHADAVNTHRILDVQWLNPVERGREEHFRIIDGTFLQEHYRERNCQDEQATAACHHHGSDTLLILN